MNIKDAELQSGISRRNIRYYKQEGLIHPARNRDNDYREYGPEEITALKRIRALRMIDMPLESIRDVVQGKILLKDAADAHRAMLSEQMNKLESALFFCEEFRNVEDLQNLDIDEVLHRMDNPKTKHSLYKKWDSDYQESYRDLLLNLLLALSAGVLSFLITYLLVPGFLAMGVPDFLWIVLRIALPTAAGVLLFLPRRQCRSGYILLGLLVQYTLLVLYAEPLSKFLGCSIHGGYFGSGWLEYFGSQFLWPLGVTALQYIVLRIVRKKR